MSDLVEIQSVGIGGDGIAVIDGKRIFVPNAAPGDIVRLKMDGPKVRIAEIVTPGSARIAAGCHHHEDCGGCRLHHIAPAALATAKTDWVRIALEQQGLENIPVAPVHTIPPASRRRAELAADWQKGILHIGFHGHNNHHITPIDGCMILSPALMAALPDIEKLAGQLLRTGEKADFHLTETEGGIDVVLTRTRAPDMQDRALIAECATKFNLARISWRTDARHQPEPVCAIRPAIIRFGTAMIELPPASFLQASQAAENIMASWTLEALDGCKNIADLFCGLGSFGLRHAQAGQKVFAADSNPAALQALRTSAKQHQLSSRLEIKQLDLSRQMPPIDIMKKWDGAIFDPPRTGATLVAQALTKAKVPKIVAISCNPATLARDMRIMVDGGYRITSVRPIDQFHWSNHVETVAVLEYPKARRGNQG